MKERSTVLNILSKALFDMLLQVDRQTDWDSLLEECQNQAVLPLVYNTVKTQLPLCVRQKWEHRAMQAIAANIRVIEAHATVHRLMTQNEIPYVILKGCAAAKYYPKPGLRMMGDVDILVEPEDVKCSSDVLLKAGLVREKGEPHPFHLAFSAQGVTYELHWTPPGIPDVGGDKIREYLRDTIETGIMMKEEDRKYIVPDDFHHGLILLLHNAVHLTAGGIGLRHLCDWAVYIEKIPDETVYETIAPCLKECGLWEFARVLTAMSMRFLGAGHRIWISDVDEELTENLLEDIWYGGNFGRKDKYRQNFGILGLDSQTRRISDRSTAASLMVAVKRKAVLLYPGLARHMLTTPIALGATGLLYLMMIITGKRAPVRLHQDVAAVRKRTELLRQLKLFD